MFKRRLIDPFPSSPVNCCHALSAFGITVGMAKQTRDEPEWLTRKTRIDGKLRALGWKIVPHTSTFRPDTADRVAVEEYPTENGPADYALFVNGRMLAIVEAKKISLGPQNVLTQAQRYSEGVAGNPFQFGKFRVPFLYSTNGEAIWFHDVRSPSSVPEKWPTTRPLPPSKNVSLGTSMPTSTSY